MDSFLKSFSSHTQKREENVNKSMKLNARAMLRKCHWLFIMGPLSRDPGGSEAAACLEMHRVRVRWRGTRAKRWSSGGEQADDNVWRYEDGVPGKKRCYKKPHQGGDLICVLRCLFHT